MKPSLERFRKLRAEVLKGPPLGDAMRIINEMGRLAVHSLSATAPPSFIPAGVIEKEWFAETAQAFSCDPPPVAAVQAMIEIVHEIQYLRWSQPPKSEFDALTGMHLEMTYQDTAAARKATDTLVRVLPRMIEFTQFLEEGPPIATTIDPRIAATMDQLIEENAKGRHEDPRSEEEPSIGNLLEQLLSAAKALQHRWGGRLRLGAVGRGPGPRPHGCLPSRSAKHGNKPACKPATNLPLVHCWRCYPRQCVRLMARTSKPRQSPLLCADIRP